MSRLYEYVHRKVILPAFLKRYELNIFPQLAELEKSQFLSSDELTHRQLVAMRRMLTYAASHVPYYRALFAQLDASPSDFQHLQDLARLPLLTKDAIRDRGDDLLSDEFSPDQVVRKRTGGSTSVPLHLVIDKEAWAFKYACTWRCNRWAGYDLGDKLAALWGDTDKKLSLRARLQRSLFERAIYLDTLKIDEAYMLRFARHMRRFKPKILFGHAHSLYLFADFIGREKIDGLGIQGIISTAEMLSDLQRRRIEEVFGPILFNRYGCEELSIIAAECEAHDGLHINSDGLIVETVGADADEPEPIVVTDLVNRAMPLIRYEIGDMATLKPGPCQCGRGLPRLSRLHGRTADFLFTPEGKAISGISILDTFTIHLPGLKQVQIIQEKVDFIVVRVVKGDDFNRSSDPCLREKIAVIFGERMHFDIVYVDRIEPTRRGKYRFSICNLSEADRPRLGGTSTRTDRGLKA